MADWKYGSFTMTYPSYSEENTASRINHYIDNSKATLVGIVEQLLQMGWSLDERHADESTPLVIYSSTSTNYYSYYGAFILRNSAGAKLLVAYGGGKFSSASDALSKTFGNLGCSTGTDSGSSYWHMQGGLMMSIIPPGTDEDFTILGENQGCSIPNTATRLVSTTHDTNSMSLPFSFNEETNEIVGTYYLLSKGNTVIVIAKSSKFNTNSRRGYIVGEIFGTLAHSADSGVGSRFGALELSAASPSIKEYENMSNGTTGIVTDSYYYVGSYTQTPRAQSMTFSRADGSHVYGEQIVILRDIDQLNSSICNSNGSTARYIPFWMAEMSANPSETGVVQGDGFKGYLSTDIIRCVRYDKFSRGQLFDGGQFVYVGGGIAIPWDPSITESIY